MNIGVIVLLIIVGLCLLLYLLGCYLFRVGVVTSYQPKTPNPKRKNSPSVSTVEQERIQQLHLQARAWRKEQPLQNVSIQSTDGLRLVGHYLPCIAAERTVLLVHGWRGGWEQDVSMFGPFLQAQRCNLLFVEQRGHGASQGKYLGFGVLERYDCLAWIRELEHREPEEMPLYLLGCSLGATTVLMTAGFQLPERVHGIVADCGFVSPEEQITTTLKDWWHMPKQPFFWIADVICRHRAGYSYREYSTLEAMKHNRIPVFFVHGKEDHFVPVSTTLRNYQACQAEKELLLVDGARHIQSYSLATERYQEKLENFFQKHDGKQRMASMPVSDVIAKK